MSLKLAENVLRERTRHGADAVRLAEEVVRLTTEVARLSTAPTTDDGRRLRVAIRDVLAILNAEVMPMARSWADSKRRDREALDDAAAAIAKIVDEATR